MELLEVQNISTVQHLFKAVSTRVRTLPTLMMILASTKLFIFCFINFLAVIITAVSGWVVAVINEREERLRREDFSGLARDTPAFDYLYRISDGSRNADSDRSLLR